MKQQLDLKLKFLFFIILILKKIFGHYNFLIYLVHLNKGNPVASGPFTKFNRWLRLFAGLVKMCDVMWANHIVVNFASWHSGKTLKWPLPWFILLSRGSSVPAVQNLRRCWAFVVLRRERVALQFTFMPLDSHCCASVLFKGVLCQIFWFSFLRL